MRRCRLRPRRFLLKGVLVVGSLLFALGPLVTSVAASQLHQIHVLEINAAPGSVAAFEIEVSDEGFNGESGELVVQVEQGQEVEITFTYGDADLNDPEQTHKVVIEGLDIEVNLDLENQVATVNFTASQAGRFKIQCKTRCKGHKALQNAILEVLPPGAGAASGPGSAPAPSTVPTSLGFLTASPAESGNSVQLSAVVQDESGQPVGGASVTFSLDGEFLGVQAPMEIGTALTEADGVAVITYEPHSEGDLPIIAEFAGVGSYEPSEARTTLTVTDAEPAYVFPGRPDLDIPGWGPAWIFLLVGAVWVTYAFVVYQVSRIRRAP